MDRSWDTEFFGYTEEHGDTWDDTTIPDQNPSGGRTRPNKPRIEAVDPIVNPGGINLKQIAADKPSVEPGSYLPHAISILSHIPKDEPPSQDAHGHATTATSPRIESKIPAHLADEVLLLFDTTDRTPGHETKKKHRTDNPPILRYMHVFVVPKPHTSLGRVIGNPKALNAARKERRFSLMTLSTLLFLLRPLKDIHALELDFKNYFPQIPLKKPTALHMGAVINGQLAIPRTLTQGWNSATFIAQSLSWAIIAFRHGNEDALGLDLDFTTSCPPPFAHVHHDLGQGIISIVYDNIVVITNSLKLRDAWHQRVKRNCYRYQVIVKYFNLTSGHFSYCGITVKEATNGFHWRTDPERFALWKQRTFPQPTPSAAYAIIAYLLRQASIRHFTLVHEGQLLKISSLIGEAMVGHPSAAWRQLHPVVSDTIFQHLQQRFKDLENPWCSEKPSRNLSSEKIFPVCTDATPDVIGWVVVSTAGVILEKYSLDIQQCDIDESEAEAMSHFAQHSRKYASTSPDHYVIMLVDNQIASRTAAAGYSRTYKVNNSITRLHTTVDPFRLLLVDCPSEHNLADGLTRDDKDLDTPDAHRRLRNTMRIIQAAMVFFSSHSTNWMSRLVLNEMCDLEE